MRITKGGNGRRARVGTIVLLLVACAASIRPVAAQSRQPVLRYQGGLGLSFTALDDAAAADADVPEGMISVAGSLSPRLFGIVAAHLEGSLGYLGTVCFDRGCFDRGYQDRDRRSDTGAAFAVHGAGAVGMFTPPLALGAEPRPLLLQAGVLGGRAWVASTVGRDDCLNCRSDVDLRGGYFVEPTLELSLGQGAGVSGSYRLYEARSDLRGTFTLRFFTSGW